MRMLNIVESLHKRVWLFPALALVTLIIGQLCEKWCTFIQGDILGIDLNIFGIMFYSSLIVAVVLYQRMYKRDWVLKTITAIVSFGVGAEIILIKFQIDNSTYCPKCLISGIFFLAMFFVLARNLNKWIIGLLIVLGALFASLTFSGSVVPSYAGDNQYPAFGNRMSGTEIIIYSDYFCPACRSVEYQINQSLMKLKDDVKISFVDVPLHKGSLEYAEMFLFSWFEAGDNLDSAIRSRELLFNAAAAKSGAPEAIAALRSKGIALKEDRESARKIFKDMYNPLMKTDKINATPTVVIIKGNKRKAYIGGREILKALGDLLTELRKK